MSVRSFFGVINQPQEGENIVYQKGGLVTSIKAMKIGGSVGEQDDFLASDGAGGLEWRAVQTGGGGVTVVPSLADVMAVGGKAGSDLDMDQFDIIKSTTLHIAAPNISIDGAVDFSVIPLCSAATNAQQPSELVSKGYVDTALAGAVGISPGDDNQWTGVNEFTGEVKISDPSKSYATLDSTADPITYYNDAKMITSPLGENIAIWDGGNYPSSWSEPKHIDVPYPTAELVGCKITVIGDTGGVNMHVGHPKTDEVARGYLNPTSTDNNAKYISFVYIPLFHNATFMCVPTVVQQLNSLPAFISYTWCCMSQSVGITFNSPINPRDVPFPSVV